MTTGRLFEYRLKSDKVKHGYTITITPADPATGKYSQLTRKGFASERAVKSAMLAHIGELDKNSGRKPKLFTLSEFAAQWMKEVIGDLRPWTLKTYNHALNY